MKPADDTSYFDEVNTHLSSFSGNIPTHRSESERKYSFNALAFGEQLAIWNALWLNPINWYTRLHAYFFLERHIKNPEHLKAMWPTIVNWQNQIDDWPLCDSLSKIYTRILEIDPKRCTPNYNNGMRIKTFGKGGNRWYHCCITAVPKNNSCPLVRL